MNLENLNLVELNAQEVSEVEGGCLGCFPFGHEIYDFGSGVWNGFWDGIHGK